MYFLSIFLLVFLSGCNEEENKSNSLPRKFHYQGSRYEVTTKEPPIVFENAAAIVSISQQYPSIVVLDRKGDIYKSDQVEEEDQKGLGPSFFFAEDYKKRNDHWFQRGSIKFSYKNNLVNGETHFTTKDVFAESVSFLGEDITTCDLSSLEGLICRSECVSLSIKECPLKTIWRDASNPIVEVNTTSHPGNYAITQNGTLFHFMREGREISDANIIHQDIKFRKNQQGRYFINTLSDGACLQSEDFAVYCSKVFLDKTGQYGLTTKEWPKLAKVVQLNFAVEQATFSGRHYCFLSETGDVYCMGDNRCGQITGRHDEIPEFNEPKKLDFLKYPATGISVYPGGSCVVLANGQVQCLGLGASVLRKRRWPDDAYRRSFSWLHGFRPYDICRGGAENGV